MTCVSESGRCSAATLQDKKQKQKSFEVIVILIFIQVQVAVRGGDLKEVSLCQTQLTGDVLP